MKTNLILGFILSMIFVSCNTAIEEATGEKESDLIEITKAQFETEKMVMDEPLMKPFAEVVYCAGIIIPSLDGQARLSLPLSGIITKIYCKPGQWISKGTVMFDVSGNGFIDEQKDFAESSAIVTRLKSDYQRAKELHKEKISTQKEFSLAESNYYAENAKYEAMKIKLQNRGLDVSKIEKGEYYSSYALKAPISGFVASVNATMGQYVEPQTQLAELIDDNSLQLKLSVFEKNIGRIESGQTVAFYLNGDKTESYKATVNSVGKTINQDTKSIACFAAIDQPKSIPIISNQVVEVEVQIAVDTVLSLPESAILHSEDESYVLMYEKEVDTMYYFKKVKINLGRKNKSYIELKEQLPSGKIVVKGVYNIQID